MPYLAKPSSCITSISIGTGALDVQEAFSFDFFNALFRNVTQLYFHYREGVINLATMLDFRYPSLMIFKISLCLEMFVLLKPGVNLKSLSVQTNRLKTSF